MSLSICDRDNYVPYLIIHEQARQTVTVHPMCVSEMPSFGCLATQGGGDGGEMEYTLINEAAETTSAIKLISVT